MPRHAPHAVTSIRSTAGHTPLVRLPAFEPPGGARLFAKCEFLGPGGSIFDRAALHELESAHRTGHLDDAKPLFAAGGTDAIVSLAMAAASLGNPLTLLVPRALASERRRLLIDYGARLELLDDATGHDAAQAEARRRAAAAGALYIDLFFGAGPVAAYAELGRELRGALGAPPEVTVCGLDLGAIPTGIARGLGGGRVVAVQPASAAVATGGTFGPHLLGGLVPGPQLRALDRTIVTAFAEATEEEGWALSAELARRTGILAGIVSGAVLSVARREAARLGPDASVVAVLPDHGERRHLLAPFLEPPAEAAGG